MLGVITIRHGLSTFMPDVGLQVWPGSLLLAEYLWAHAATFRDAVAVELGCGTGVTGLVLALLGVRRVWLTDCVVPVVHNVAANVQANAHVLDTNRITVKLLDLCCFSDVGSGHALSGATAGTEMADCDAGLGLSAEAVPAHSNASELGSRAGFRTRPFSFIFLLTPSQPLSAGQLGGRLLLPGN